MQSYINVHLDTRGETFRRRGLPMMDNDPYSSVQGTKAKLKYFLRKLLTFLFSQVGVGAILLLYTVLGATIFQAIESDVEKVAIQDVRNLREKVVSKLWNVTKHYNVIHIDKWKFEVDSVIREFQQELLVHVKREGYNGDDEETEEPWTFPKALMYSLSIYTTIGYSNLTPRTDWGKVISCVYALFGIPLLLLYMANIGNLLSTSFIKLYVALERCKSRIRQEQSKRSISTSKPQDEEEGQLRVVLNNNPKFTPEVNIQIPISTCFTLFTIYILLGSLIFASLEDWSLIDGSYFCFTSLVTIGFGDLVPGQTLGKNQNQNKVDGQLILCSVYILFGMGLMSTLFHLTQERFFITARKLGTTLHLTKNKEGELN